MRDRFELIVIGGGPAGSAAAITAARDGRRVLLLERGQYPRQKVCGEFVSAESLGLLGEFIPGSPLIATAPRIAHTRVFFQDGGFEAAIDPAAASMPRYKLDQALWNAAVAAGAHARQQCGRVNIEHSGNGFVVRSESGSFESERVIYAAGRAVGAAPSGPWIGIKAHFEADDVANSVDLYFSATGYCGVQAIGEAMVNVCALVRAQDVKKAGSERMMAAFAVHPKLRAAASAWRQATETSATPALAFGVPQPVRAGMLCAGDAAGFIDPFLGDGISLALQTGALAARAESAEIYAREYRAQFLPLFRRAARLRRLIDSPAPVRKAALLLMKWPGVSRALVNRTRAGARNTCLSGSR